MSEDSLVNDIGINSEQFKQKYSKSLNDVLSKPQTLNSYSYVSNNPLVKVDPSGEAEIYIRNAGPGNAHNLNWYEQGGHVLIKAEGNYYGFAPLNDKKHINDVQTYTSDEAFKDEYKGQTWNVVDIGDKYDESIISQFTDLMDKGDKKEGIYRTLTNNCAEKAYDILKNAGVWNNRVGMPRTVLPNQMSKQFSLYQKAEKVYSIFNKSYEPLVKSIKTIKNNK